MPRLDPDHRAFYIFTLVSTKASYQGDHPDEMALYHYLTSRETNLPNVIDAYDLYVHPEHRHILSALIIGKGTNEQISSALSMSIQTINSFKHLFFDKNIFRHDLEANDYVRNLRISPEYAAHYALACEKGFRILANKFRIGEKPPIDPKEAFQELLADQLDRARAHRGQRIDSEIAREALRWGHAASATANLLMRYSPTENKNVLEELKLALLTRDDTASIEDLDIKPGELFH